MLQCRRRTRGTRQFEGQQALAAAVCDHGKERKDQARVAAGVGAGVNLWTRANFRRPITMLNSGILAAEQGDAKARSSPSKCSTYM